MGDAKTVVSLSYLIWKRRRRCPHLNGEVTADILDGDFHVVAGADQAVQWCRRCGSYRRVFDVYGLRPQFGDWTTPGKWLVK